MTARGGSAVGRAFVEGILGPPRHRSSPCCTVPLIVPESVMGRPPATLSDVKAAPERRRTRDEPKKDATVAVPWVAFQAKPPTLPVEASFSNWGSSSYSSVFPALPSVKTVPTASVAGCLSASESD